MTQEAQATALRAGEPPLTRCADACALGPVESVRDVDFGVKFGELRTCSRCGWRLYDDWTAARAGSVERWLPPEVQTEEASGDAAHSAP